MDVLQRVGAAAEEFVLTEEQRAMFAFLDCDILRSCFANLAAVEIDDDGGGSGNSRIPSFSGFFTLPVSGTYRIFATSYSADGITGSTGPYALSVFNSTAVTPTLQFSASTYNVNESAGFLNITITRSGDTSGPSSVAYATSNATAREGRDYIAAQGTLHFAAGETSKTFPVLIIDNAFVDGTRTVNLTLSNATGATLGTTTSLLTINDNDIVLGPNPVDQPRSFVQLHYFDFLGRYPDQSGWDFWTNNITGCTPQPSCTEVQRINTSAAYFLSIEFQQTGYLVYKSYKASFGNLTNIPNAPVPIKREEFLPDTQEIGNGVIVNQGNWQQQLETNKQAFTLEFVQRSRFVTAFPTTMTPAQFKSIRQRIDDDGLLFKVRVLAQEIQKQKKTRPAAPAQSGSAQIERNNQA